MRDSGKRTNKTGKVLNLGLMEPRMKVSTNKVKNAGPENSDGQMDQYTRDSLWIIISMAEVFISGLIRDSMLETGKIIKWTGMELSHGQIKENT
jgi:hypothetical protein